MCLHLKKNICLFKIMKSKELSKKYKKKLSVYKKKQFKTKPLHPDDCWRLQAAPGAACDSWRLLATAGDSWALSASSLSQLFLIKR